MSLSQDFEFAQLSVGDAENFGGLYVAEVPLPCPELGSSASMATVVFVLALRARRR